MEKIGAKSMNIQKWLWDRLTLIALILFQPIFTTAVLFARWSAQTIGNLIFLSCIIVITLGLDASLRIRRRSPATKSLRSEHRNTWEDVLDGAHDLLTPLILLASVQITFRKTFTISTDEESVRLLGYVPSDAVINHLVLGTAVWALVSAYVIKYYWDDLITLLERRRLPPTA